MPEEIESFNARDYLAGFSDLMAGLGYAQGVQRDFIKTIETPQATFRVHVDGASLENHRSGYLFVEGRPNDWMSIGTWNQHGQFKTLLTHSFEKDPPTEYLKRLDQKLASFSGTFDDMAAELTRDKSELIALDNRAYKARKYVESAVDGTADSDNFNARDYFIAGDWLDALTNRGWYRAPGFFESVRKDYSSPHGWAIHVWVERQRAYASQVPDVLVTAYGPNADSLGSLFLDGDHDVIATVKDLERLIRLDQPYEVVAKSVRRFLMVGKNESGRESTMKAKQLFETSRVPYWFPKDRDTWLDCREGKIRVHWLGNRWIILPRGHRAVYPDERELRDAVTEYVMALGGLAR